VGGCCAECCDRHNAQLTQLPALAQYIRELGIDVEIVKVDYTTGEHKTPEYLKV
jgi:glutathione S-transferase